MRSQFPMSVAGVESDPPYEAPEGSGTVDRRALRSRYLAVKNLISEEKADDAGSADQSKFRSFFTRLENLHELVQNPREQVADAEALLGVTNSLLMMVKSQIAGGINPSEFVNALLMKFRQKELVSDTEKACNMISWKDIGVSVSRIFKNGLKCHTMVGPMDSTLKQRNNTAAAKRKRLRPTEICYPEELSQTEPEAKNDTERNIITMFSILRKNKRARLENLVLNRLSFAQTVENIFALSFLVKDGRAEIAIDDDGYYLISPRNAPVAKPDDVAAAATLHHFMLRFDFKDWKLMSDFVLPGKELMQNRSNANTCFPSLDVAVPGEETPCVHINDRVERSSKITI